MSEQHKGLDKERDYEVEDDVTSFLNLTPDDVERLKEMILKARFEWLMSQ